MAQIFVGSVVHWNTGNDCMEYLDSCNIVVKDGRITSMTTDESSITQLNGNSTSVTHHLGPHQFLIPGFVDAHVHAPQYPNLGLGVDLPLLTWLKTYIFNLERRFEDLDFAKTVYEKVVNRTLACGTTTASYFGTIHTDACLVLADVLHRRGQRGFVGKVNMTVNCEEYYGESVDESLMETERFVMEMQKRGYPLVQPIITPRFAVTCDMDTLTRLAQIAEKYDLPIQTHVSENQAEISEVKRMNPKCNTYTEVYDRAGLLTKKTILAHGIHLSEEELEVIGEQGASIIHCPASNCFLHSGVCDTVKIAGMGINIGLGTDMGAGYSPSILETARRSLEVSSVLNFARRDGAHHEVSTGKAMTRDREAVGVPLNFERAFYYATMGGAKALNLADQIGNFAPGKQFDALLINLVSPYSAVEFATDLSLQENFLKFFFTGDDRNIERVFVAGKQVVNKTLENKKMSVNTSYLDGNFLISEI